MRRRWTFRVRDAEGTEHTFVVAVPRGQAEVRVFVDGRVWVLNPEEVSKMRRVYQEAQAAALMERGTF
jgi:hypothetical protein